MNLSEHFTEAEFTYSDTAKARGINNSMDEAHKKEAVHTCTYLLEPIRKLLNDTYKTYAGKPVHHVGLRITSGYRGPTLNAAVGSKNTSQHCKAQAADIEAVIYFKDNTKKVLSYNELYELLKKATKEKKVTIDQCIQEKSGAAQWVHVSLANQLKDCRKQFLKYNGSTYTLDVDLP